MGPEHPDPVIALAAGTFCFLRHGETENNRLGLIAGATDVPLNRTGLEQAEEAARRLASIGVDAVWSSPLIRALATAEVVAAALDVPVDVIPQLAERCWGELEGRPRSLRTPGLTPPGGESPAEFRARTLAGLGRIRASRLPLIVAHSGTFRVLCDWLGIPPRVAAVANALPLRFDPTAAGWSMCEIGSLS